MGIIMKVGHSIIWSIDTTKWIVNHLKGNMENELTEKAI
jgi:hypothetical protein